MDTTLVSKVDEICEDIKATESAINLLFLGREIINFRTSMPLSSRYDSTEIATSEGIRCSTALTHYCPARFIVNLLPLLQQATTIRRVVTVLAADFGVTFDTTDNQGLIKWSSGPGKLRMCDVATLALQELAKQAPEVTFIGSDPEYLNTVVRDLKNAPKVMATTSLAILSMIETAYEECGARHLFLSTSAKYPAGAAENGWAGVLLLHGGKAAKGISGKVGSGVYSVEETCKSSGSSDEARICKVHE